jgi:hypothetical protein
LANRRRSRYRIGADVRIRMRRDAGVDHDNVHTAGQQLITQSRVLGVLRIESAHQTNRRHRKSFRRSLPIVAPVAPDRSSSLGPVRHNPGMKYALLMCDDETDSPSNEELDADPVHQAWLADLDRRGGRLAGVRLRPVVDATTVRVRQDETLVSDGPFAETKDFVGGFVIVECENLDEAIAIASGHPYARRGSVEIRPVWE